MSFEEDFDNLEKNQKKQNDEFFALCEELPEDVLNAINDYVLEICVSIKRFHNVLNEITSDKRRKRMEAEIKELKRLREMKQ